MKRWIPYLAVLPVALLFSAVFPGNGGEEPWLPLVWRHGAGELELLPPPGPEEALWVLHRGQGVEFINASGTGLKEIPGKVLGIQGQDVLLLDETGFTYSAGGREPVALGAGLAAIAEDGYALRLAGDGLTITLHDHTGQELWTRTGTRVLTAARFLGDGAVAVGDLSGTVRGVDPQGQELWNLEVADSPGAPDGLLPVRTIIWNPDGGRLLCLAGANIQGLASFRIIKGMAVEALGFRPLPFVVYGSPEVWSLYNGTCLVWSMGDTWIFHDLENNLFRVMEGDGRVANCGMVGESGIYGLMTVNSQNEARFRLLFRDGRKLVDLVDTNGSDDFEMMGPNGLCFSRPSSLWKLDWGLK